HLVQLGHRGRVLAAVERLGRRGRLLRRGRGRRRGWRRGRALKQRVDRDTIDLYERAADEWVARRSPSHMAAAEAFASRVPDGGGAVADLGCGPGWYAPALPAPVVALDATRAM